MKRKKTGSFTTSSETEWDTYDSDTSEKEFEHSLQKVGQSENSNPFLIVCSAVNTGGTELPGMSISTPEVLESQSCSSSGTPSLSRSITTESVNYQYSYGYDCHAAKPLFK